MPGPSPCIAFALVVCAAAVSGCVFDAGVAPEAEVSCADDDDCPADRQCNLARLRCVAAGSDVTPPVITAMGFSPPAVRQGTSRFVIEANEALLDAVPLVGPAPGSLALPLVFAGVDGARASFDVDSADLAEGAYAIGRVEVQDAANNAGAVDAVNVALVVDRTPPDLINLAVVGAPPAGLSDVEGANALSLTFFASETLAADAAAALGPLRGACSLVDARTLQMSCALTIAPGAVADGENGVVVAASDLAGNAVERVVPVDVDTAAPTVLADSVSVIVRAPDGSPSATATAAGRIELSFLVSERLADDPVVTLDAGAAGFAIPVTAVGARYAGAAVVPAGVPEGTYAIRVVLRDGVGHEADATLPLPAPFSDGIAVGAAAVTGCPTLDTFCVDADGDGFFGANGGCATSDDCNDLNATVFPNAPEIPGDGFANACSGADVPIDDATGVFIDPDFAGVPLGTQAAPVRSLDDAARLLDEERRFLFLKAGIVVNENSGVRDGRSLVGALVVDPLTGRWSRQANAERSVIQTPGTTMRLVGAVAYDGLSLVANSTEGVVVEGTALIVRSDLPRGGTVSGEATFVDDVFTNFVVANAASARFVQSTVGGPGGLTVVGRAFVFRSTLARLQVQGSADLVSSGVVGSSPDPLISTAAPAAALRLWHVTVARTELRLTSLIETHLGLSELVIAGSSLVNRGDTFFLVIASVQTNVFLEHNAFARRQIESSSRFLQQEATVFEDAAAVNALSGSRNVIADANQEIAALPFDDDLSPSAVSALRDADVPFFVRNAPSSVVVDLDGGCRYADADVDIGADEL